MASGDAKTGSSECLMNVCSAALDGLQGAEATRGGRSLLANKTMRVYTAARTDAVNGSRYPPFLSLARTPTQRFQVRLAAPAV